MRASDPFMASFELLERLAELDPEKRETLEGTLRNPSLSDEQKLNSVATLLGMSVEDLLRMGMRAEDYQTAWQNFSQVAESLENHGGYLMRTSPPAILTQGGCLGLSEELATRVAAGGEPLLFSQVFALRGGEVVVETIPPGASGEKLKDVAAHLGELRTTLETLQKKVSDPNASLNELMRDPRRILSDEEWKTISTYLPEGGRLWKKGVTTQQTIRILDKKIEALEESLKKGNYSATQVQETRKTIEALKRVRDHLAEVVELVDEVWTLKTKVNEGYSEAFKNLSSKDRQVIDSAAAFGGVTFGYGVYQTLSQRYPQGSLAWYAVSLGAAAAAYNSIKNFLERATKWMKGKSKEADYLPMVEKDFSLSAMESTLSAMLSGRIRWIPPRQS